jgi:hypothetical protein
MKEKAMSSSGWSNYTNDSVGKPSMEISPSINNTAQFDIDLLQEIEIQANVEKQLQRQIRKLKFFRRLLKLLTDSLYMMICMFPALSIGALVAFNSNISVILTQFGFSVVSLTF